MKMPEPFDPPQSHFEKDGWGFEALPYPKGFAYISTRWDRCIGCGACETACSMFHYGTINRHLSRIRIYRYLLPLPKSVQSVCCHCREEERECQKSCPIEPSAIYYDDSLKHMVVNTETCLGVKCGKCRRKCPANVPQFYPPFQEAAMVCDLCERDGKRQPQCVDICPARALQYIEPKFPQHLERIHPSEKAQHLAKRLYPLQPDRALRLPEEIWGHE